jgi:hypothetical protein
MVLSCCSHFSFYAEASGENQNRDRQNDQAQYSQDHELAGTRVRSQF